MNLREHQLLRFGPFTVDLHTHEFRKNSVRIRLVGQPFEILAELLRRPGELVTREQLRERLWPGDTFVDFDHGLNAAVNKLREALCDSADDPRYIETLPRRGYRFIGTLENQASSPAPSPAGANPGSPPEPAAAPAVVPAFVGGSPATDPARRSSSVWIPAILFALFAAVFLFRNEWSAGRSSASPVPPPRIEPLTGPSEAAGYPAFSPDGKSVAYFRQGNRAEDSGIYVRAIGSEEPRQLLKSDWLCCTAWSPDGQFLAFVEYQNNLPSFRIASVADGAIRRLEIPGPPPASGELDWSPDGKFIALNSGSGIALYSVRNSSLKLLTAPPPLTRDWGPAFSPDGESIVFSRSSDMGFPEQILKVSAAGGAPVLLSTEVSRLRGSPRWSADGRSIIFSSDRGGKPALWRVSAQNKDAAIQFNDNGSHPVISRQGNRLAYQRETRNLSVWQLNVSSDEKSATAVLIPITSQTDQGPGPQFSPDGAKIAYMSDRSGAMEIWVSDHDGVNSRQLTSVGNAGTPRWSPDGKFIVFDSDRRGASAIYVVGLDGGTTRLLTDDAFENRCPSWSRDGKWIYFASTRTNQWQVWKIPAQGGTPRQVTRLGGHAAMESADGKFLYYAKTPIANPQIWKVPAAGGPETLASPLIRPPSWASWTVIRGGILFAASSGKSAPVVNIFDTATHKVRTVGTLGIPPFWLTATMDGKTVAFDTPGMQESQIMLIENFR
jgi:Tol biopolymer transport system component/DNA-binding winged helix-turn-helix (wHTH) protein